MPYPLTPITVCIYWYREEIAERFTYDAYWKLHHRLKQICGKKAKLLKPSNLKGKHYLVDHKIEFKITTV